MTEIYMRPTRTLPMKQGFIFWHHLSINQMCAIGSRRFFLNKGLSRAEINHFHEHGMSYEDFAARFNNDAMVLQAIEFAKAYDAEREVAEQQG